MVERTGRAADDIEAIGDLARWGKLVYAHANLDGFLTTRTLNDGIHVISYCTAGMSLTKRVLAFLFPGKAHEVMRSHVLVVE